jgi:hypothetical protein
MSTSWATGISGHDGIQHNYAMPATIDRLADSTQ